MSSVPPDDPLSPTLANWRISPQRNPGFRVNVWARIEATRQPSTWSRFVRSHPAALVVLLLTSIAAGAWTGRTEARQRTDAERMMIAATYVHSLDARWMRNP